ncbi:site-specific integrase [Cobetia amphilecti]|uniref:site-specific integrase n=1 Tax=Cobetia amphilecti TaxID=1055104 RepID=UPI0032973B7C
MAIPYTVRKPSGVYHFRWRIPSEYQHLGNELRISLATKDKHEARLTAASLRLKVGDLVGSVSSLEELRRQLSPDCPQRPSKGRQHTDEPKGPAEALSALWERYRAHQLADARDKTRHESRHALGVLVELVGDVDPRRLDKSVARDFVERLEDYPSRRGLGRFASMSLAQIKAGSYQPISNTTQRNIITRVSSFAAWLVSFGYLDANPLQGLKPKRAKGAAKRKTWTHDELRTWFGSSAGQTGTGWQYWLPLLAIYTGARLEELAALAPDDIGRHDGIDYLEIHGTDGRHIKNAASWRAVPIHPRLIELGFLDLVASRQGCERLFDLPRRQGRYGFTASKWFTRHRAKLGIAADFHGYRHTVAEALRLAGGQGYAIAWLLGHSAQSMTDHYGSDAGKRQRLAALASLVGLLDWSTVEALPSRV